MSALFVVARRAHIVARCVGREVIGDGSIAPLKLKDHHSEIEVEEGVITPPNNLNRLPIIAIKVKQTIAINIKSNEPPK